MGHIKELFQTWLEDHATKEELSLSDEEREKAFWQWVQTKEAFEQMQQDEELARNPVGLGNLAKGLFGGPS